MASKKRPPQFVARFETSLLSSLKAAGIAAEVDHQPVPATKLYRMMVMAPKFKALKHYERQDLVWRIAEKILASNEQFKISIILTLTPDEAAGR